jgi:hypothetical protein
LIFVLTSILANGTAAAHVGTVTVFASKLAEAMVIDRGVEEIPGNVGFRRCLDENTHCQTGAHVPGAEAKMTAKVAKSLEGPSAAASRACGG